MDRDRASGRPSAGASAAGSVTELHMDPPEPVPYAGEGNILGELPPHAIDELLEVAGPGSGSRRPA